jgi:predicted component of type VI protein secretion system
MARKKTRESDGKGLTPKKARNAISVAKIVVPAVAPVLIPVAVRAAGAAREAYDRYQARKLGVPVERLSEFTGRGAGLLARIAGVSEALTELRKSGRATEDDREFAADAHATLEQLTAAVHAAERMPASRRKAAHQAVTSELERLESQLLRRLGV